MAEIAPREGRRAQRLNAVAALAVCGLVLIAAHALTPDPRGFGTHEHLYLPPCLFHTFTHIPCPFCGMTTGFAHMARGEVVDALRSNPATPLLYALTWLGVLVGLRGLLTGARMLPAWMTGRAATRIIVIVLAVFWLVHILYVLAPCIS